MKSTNYLLPLALLMSVASTADAKDLRIINGKPIDIESRPWMVGLVNKAEAPSDVFCGASLIAPRWVLTAAHCVVGVADGSVDAVAGTAKLDETIAERITVEKIIMHQKNQQEYLNLLLG